MFDDGFRLRWWHGALWLVLVVAGFWMCMAPSRPLGLALTLSSLAFGALAMIQAFASWKIDLVERRRRLRLFVVVASSLYIAITAVAQLAGLQNTAPAEGSLAGALGLLAISGVAAIALVQVSHRSLFPVLAETPRPAAASEAVTTTPAESVGSEPIDAADQALLAQLGRLMTAERAYRQDGLTIATLAQQVGVPEYKLRRLINQGLGYRNFNSFVNHYRIAEIQAALADPKQAEVPVLTMALDAGFSSLGPFNRAFKAETGLTPSEYRRQQTGNSEFDPPIPESASRIPDPARGNLAAN
jgi:AraC-like DNA-binding protein